MDTNAAVQVIGLTNVVAISCDHGFSLAQKNDGTVWGWGDNQHGQLGIGTFTGVYNNPVQVTSLCSMLSSLNETERENVFSVFPNPTSELIWIKMNTFNYSKGSSIEIYNSTGALFYKTCIDSPEIVVDLSTYSKGLYIIKLFDGKVSQTKRMVIE